MPCWRRLQLSRHRGRLWRWALVWPLLHLRSATACRLLQLLRKGPLRLLWRAFSMRCLHGPWLVRHLQEWLPLRLLLGWWAQGRPQGRSLHLMMMLGNLNLVFCVFCLLLQQLMMMVLGTLALNTPGQDPLLHLGRLQLLERRSRLQMLLHRLPMRSLWLMLHMHRAVL